ncbi:restriction endonuclease subunit M [Acidithiobacillus caldus]|uniref:site-specific DNA-methyltransferase (adenine-specific) n=1 Tax=Acidithiobacillus caldus TaxID=33059 RepID=A0A1E7YTN1_9PROT|nr:restriction endonuclease subunit M [Acidithiobacillus caldus]
MTQQNLSALIWAVAELLRGDFKQSEYGRVILPFTVLRRLDCVLAPTRAAALAEYQAKSAAKLPFAEFVRRAAGQPFFNLFPQSLPGLLGDAEHLRDNLLAYVRAFSVDVEDIFLRFDFPATIERLHKAGLLYLVTEKFAGLDLHPDSVSNYQMGLLFEELLRRFSEMSNETAGEHYTPREVIQLMVELLFCEDDAALAQASVVRTLYDPTAGTGGMLSVAAEYLHGINPNARLTLFGQELNDESYATCKADMLLRGQDVGNILPGNTLSDDGHRAMRFDYMLSNPPFGVEWKKVEDEVRAEHEERGYRGRFGPGLPRISDGSLLFLLHLLSKMRPVKDGGSRIGIVLNGSPLFTGSAGSGESEIRRYVLEKDYVEAIVALPTDMFFNTGIATYVWILSNRKAPERAGMVQLIDGSGFWRKMRKSLGSKRRELAPEHIRTITRILGSYQELQQAVVLDAEGKELERRVLFAGEPMPEAPEGGKIQLLPVSRIFRTTDFGYRTITVERPLRLRFQMTPERMEGYAQKLQEKLDGGGRGPKRMRSAEAQETARAEVERLLADAEALREALGEAVYDDWNTLWPRIEGLLEARGSRYTPAQRKVFRDAFSESCPEAAPVLSGKRQGPKYEPDTALRDTENVPLGEDVYAYFAREVLPHVPDAWIDETKRDTQDGKVGIVGYEIPFNRHFYVYEPPRPLAEIRADLQAVTARILEKLQGMAGA